MSKHNIVTLIDVDKKKIERINNKRAPIEDHSADGYWKWSDLNLTGMVGGADSDKILSASDYIIIAVPTNLCKNTQRLDLHIIDSVLMKAYSLNNNALFIIKSTVPIGYTDYICKRLHTSNVVFSPEFSRESKSLYDTFFPSRIIVSYNNNNNIEKVQKFIEELKVFDKKIIICI